MFSDFQSVKLFDGIGDAISRDVRFGLANGDIKKDVDIYALTEDYVGEIKKDLASVVYDAIWSAIYLEGGEEDD